MYVIHYRTLESGKYFKGTGLNRHRLYGGLIIVVVIVVVVVVVVVVVAVLLTFYVLIGQSPVRRVVYE